MEQKTIIGAGLSGMVAGITLARKGYRVLIRERRPEPGGAVTLGEIEEGIYQAGDGTTMDLGAMKRYTGIDFSPVAVPLEKVEARVYGKPFPVRFAPRVHAYLFERGPRVSSLDSYLYGLSLEAGVEFSFNDTLGEEEFSCLESGAIIATGLFNEAVRGLDLPEVRIYGHLASEETGMKDTRTVLYFDEFTRDYAFYTRLGGVHGAVLFSREWPFRENAARAFREVLYRDEGVEFEEWFYLAEGSVIHGNFRSPRLFWRNQILAGTLSGMQDPFLFFGVHGALISGKIAALAVEEPAIALREFRRINALYPFALCQSYIHRYCPVPMLRPLLRMAFRMYPRVAGLAGRSLFMMIPGYGRI